MLPFEQIEAAIRELSRLSGGLAAWFEAIEIELRKVEEASKSLPPHISTFERLVELKTAITISYEGLAQSLGLLVPQIEAQVKIIELTAPHFLEGVEPGRLTDSGLLGIRRKWSLAIDSLEGFEDNLRPIAGSTREATLAFEVIENHLMELAKILNRYWFALGDIQQFFVHIKEH